MVRFRQILFVIVLASSLGTACGGNDTDSARVVSTANKVLVIGIPGVSWSDIGETDAPSIAKLISSGASGALAVRVSNKLGEAYATLGAGQRTDADHSAGWAFNAGEIVENSRATAMLERRGGIFDGDAVIAATIVEIKLGNTGRAFEARPGMLAESLGSVGKKIAVLGNADFSKGPLPATFPSALKMELRDPPDPGVHREVVLAAMDSEGGVPAGDVGRGLLEESEDAAFGIATSRSGVMEAFREVWPVSDLVFVEAGDTYRSDIYSVGMREELSTDIRRRGLAKADTLVRDLMEEIDEASTLVILLAPTTPGGPTQRGELRPVLVSGPGVARGVLKSSNTRRKGILVLPDVTALIAATFDAGGDRFGAGRVPSIAAEANPVDFLAGLNDRAVAHDKARLPVSATAVGLQFSIYLGAIVLMRSRRGGRPMPAWMTFLLIASVAFPGATFFSTWGPWSRDPWVVALAVITANLGLATAAMTIFRGRGLEAATAVLAATSLMFLGDLFVGARSQIDSILGYTSVAAGRFFGLGNLGFAIFATASLLVAGYLVGKDARSRYIAVGVALATLFAIGHPLLGADVGGTMAMVPAVGVFGFALFDRRLPRLSGVIAAFAVVLLIVAFGAIDLARPAVERTHLGDFMAQLLTRPLGVWPLIKRKAGLAIALAISTGWGVGAIGAGAVLLWLQIKSRELLRVAFSSRPGLSPSIKAVIVAAAVGSLVNDSGLAVAGMMLTMATPWMLLLANTSPQNPGS